MDNKISDNQKARQLYEQRRFEAVVTSVAFIVLAAIPFGLALTVGLNPGLALVLTLIIGMLLLGQIPKNRQRLDQQRFQTHGSQAGLNPKHMHSADRDVLAGRVERSDSAEAFLNELDS
jgi:hypothetical protein